MYIIIIIIEIIVITIEIIIIPTTTTSWNLIGIVLEDNACAATEFFAAFLTHLVCTRFDIGNSNGIQLKIFGIELQL